MPENTVRNFVRHFSSKFNRTQSLVENVVLYKQIHILQLLKQVLILSANRAALSLSVSICFLTSRFLPHKQLPFKSIYSLTEISVVPWRKTLNIPAEIVVSSMAAFLINFHVSEISSF